VPISFERHVQEVLPSASHLELSCGHVPQLERPKETHEAIEQFFLEGRQCRRRGGERPAVTA
jgi:pimeloyl-ACP methyl ester carboxylesterase